MEKDAFTGRRALDGTAFATIHSVDATTERTEATPGDSEGPGDTWWARLGTSSYGNASRTTGEDIAVAALSGLSCTWPLAQMQPLYMWALVTSLQR